MLLVDATIDSQSSSIVLLRTRDPFSGLYNLYQTPPPPPEYLHDRIHDTDERVRLEAVKAVCEAMSDDHTSVPEKVRRR